MRIAKFRIQPEENRVLTSVFYHEGKLAGVELNCPLLYGGTRQYYRFDEPNFKWVYCTHDEVMGNSKKLDIYSIPNFVGTMEFPTVKEPLNLPRTGYGFTMAQAAW